MCELTLVGLCGEDGPSVGVEAFQCFVEDGDGLSEDVDDAFVVSSPQLILQLLLILLDISSDGGNLIIQLVLVSA